MPWNRLLSVILMVSAILRRQQQKSTGFYRFLDFNGDWELAMGHVNSGAVNARAKGLPPTQIC